jgi:hypothetical protein
MNTLLHEIEHLKHAEYNKELNQKKYLIKVLNKEEKNKQIKLIKDKSLKQVTADFYNLILHLKILPIKLLEEGIAQYSIEFRSKEKKDWLSNYEEIKIKVLNVRNNYFNSLFKFKESRIWKSPREEIIKSYKEELNSAIAINGIVNSCGSHMVYTISLTDSKIYFLNEKQFISLYTQLCESEFKRKPLISLDSNKGEIDINTTIEAVTMSYQYFMENITKV